MKVGAERVIAVDVGGTGIKAALCDADSPELAPVAELIRPTPVADGVPAVVEAIATLIDELGADQDSSVGVGVILPGAVEAEGGVARYSANIGWRDLPIRDLLAARTGRPVAIEHDVRAAGLAEAERGAAADQTDALFVAIGTGIAAASIVAGRIVPGAGALAGEIGHVPAFPDGIRCACGQRGCTEAYASAAALARRYQQATGRAAPAEQVIARAAAGDPAAITVYGQAVTALARTLLYCTMLTDPALIVLGGGLAQAGDTLLQPLRDQLAAGLTWRQPPPLAIARFGARAGQVGAGLIGLRAARASRRAGSEATAAARESQRPG